MFIKRLSILFTSAVAVLVLSACDNGDGAGRYPGGVEPTATPDPGVTPAPSPEPNSVSMSGVAAKGLILGGVVNVYPIVDGRVGSEPLAASVVTEDDGSYSLTIADYDGGPVVVRVTADQDTQMICDLSSGCGNGSSFGDTIALSDSDFKLDAIIPGAEGGTFESVNVSVLTNTAATTALNELAEAQDVSQVNLANLIADANSRVANRFGLLGDLYSIPLIDVTNPANLVGVDSRIIEFAFINTAVVQAILQGNGDFSIAQAANQFVAQYAANGGLADREATDTTAVSLAEILAEVSRILEVVQTAIENDPSVAVDLSQLAVSIRNDRELAEMGSTEPSNGLPSDGNQSDLEKVKGMVDSIRRLASVDLADTEFFMDEIEMASETFDADAGAHFQALAWALEAMVSAGNAYQRDNTLTTHTDDSTGIAVGISADETEVTYSVEDVTVTIGDGEEAVDITLDLSAIDGSYETAMSDTDSAETTSGSSTDADTVSGEIALSLSGSSASSAVLLSISEGELSGAGAAEYSNTESDSQMDTEAAASIDANLSELMLKAVVSLQEQQGDNPITFEGALQLDIDGLAVDASETESYISSNSVATFMDQWSVGFDELAFSASGSFSSAAGQSIVASFSLDATPDGMVYSCHSEDSVALQAKTCTSETESEYLALSFGVIVQLNVDSLADELTISVSGTRQGLQDADLRVNIRNAATMLEFNYDTADLDNDMQSLSITNEAGAVLSVTRAMMEGEYRITGNIVLDEVEYATIEEVRNFTAVRYNDGFNETF